MGEFYIKKNENGEEHVYEKGFFKDEDRGKLHEKWDGSKETKNTLGPDIKVEREKFLHTSDRKATVDGEEGDFTRNTGIEYASYERIGDNFPKFRPHEKRPEEKDHSDSRERPSDSSSISSDSSSDVSFSPPSPKEERTTKSEPWQVTAGNFSKFFGLKSLSKFFFSAASDVYLRRGDTFLSGYLKAEAGDFDSAFHRLIVAEEITEAKKIARENNLERKLLEKLEIFGKKEETAELAEESEDIEKAISLYEEAALRTGDEEETVRMVGYAGELAEAYGKTEDAIRLYKKAAGLGTRSEIDGVTVFIPHPLTKMLAEKFMDNAKKLEKTNNKS